MWPSPQGGPWEWKSWVKSEMAWVRQLVLLLCPLGCWHPSKCLLLGWHSPRPQITAYAYLRWAHSLPGLRQPLNQTWPSSLYLWSCSSPWAPPPPREESFKRQCIKIRLNYLPIFISQDSRLLSCCHFRAYVCSFWLGITCRCLLTPQIKGIAFFHLKSTSFSGTSIYSHVIMVFKSWN